MILSSAHVSHIIITRFTNKYTSGLDWIYSHTAHPGAFLHAKVFINLQEGATWVPPKSREIYPPLYPMGQGVRCRGHLVVLLLLTTASSISSAALYIHFIPIFKNSLTASRGCTTSCYPHLGEFPTILDNHLRAEPRQHQKSCAYPTTIYLQYYFKSV